MRRSSLPVDAATPLAAISNLQHKRTGSRSSLETLGVLVVGTVVVNELEPESFSGVTHN